MDTQLSERWAKFNIVIVAIFYLISGAWEFFMGITQGEGLDKGIYFLLGVYRDYLIFLGWITMLTGILLLFRINLARLAAIILSRWNLFTAPLFYIWWVIYTVYIKKFLTIDLSFFSNSYTIIVMLAMTAMRLYIIYMLKIPKAGYICLRKKKNEITD